jgi:hypothetical protein
MRLAIAFTVVALATRTAAAAPDPLAAYLGDLAKDPKAAAAHLKHCDLLVTPGGEARTPCALTLKDLVGDATGVTLVATRTKSDQIDKSSIEYVEADVEARAAGKVVATFHVLEVGTMGGDDAFSPSAVHWARTISDKDAVAHAKAGQLTAAPALADKVVPPPPDTTSDHDEAVSMIRDLFKGTDDLKSELSYVAGVGVVFGSAPGQRYTGKSGGKQIKGWKLGLVPRPGATIAGGDLVIYGVGHVVATTKDKPAATITYVAFVVGSMHMIAESGDHVWEPKIISFAVPQ